jgi:leucyl-tRNA synthetase
MVCHETYKDDKGGWLYPSDLVVNGTNVTTKDGKAVKVGRIEKMSKSKRNVVEPEVIIAKYGADTARVFVLSDSPPDRDIEWTSSGVEGVYKYLNRLLKLADEIMHASVDEGDEELKKLVHQTIHHVTEDLEKFHFNKAIARIRELTNFIGSDSVAIGAKKFAMSYVTRLLNPFAPHITEEIWERLGFNQILALSEWPIAKSEYLVKDSVIIAVQVNGKMRGTIELAFDSSQEDVLLNAKSLHAVADQLVGKEMKKVIFIPNKIINLICS